MGFGGGRVCEHAFVSAEATILHADADAFFASVEQRDDPALRGRPVCVGEGVVMAASYEARAFGIRGAMGGGEARRLCPDALFVPPRFSAYTEASRGLFAVFREMAPAVEGLSLEEAFLDVRGLERVSGTPEQIARKLRREAREQVGLAVTVGVARTKVLAKMASRAAKPNGLLVVAPDREREFLDPLPVETLWGVGPSTAQKLYRHGIRRVHQIAELPESVMVSILGKAAGQHLHAVANNRDRRRVRADSRRGSFGSQSAFGRRPKTQRQLDAILIALVDRVTGRMRKAGRAGRTVVLRLRFADYSRATRSSTLPHATSSSGPVLATARALLAAAMPLIRRRGITMIGVAVSNLAPRGGGLQLGLPLDRVGGDALDAALDEIHERFGVNAVRRPSHLAARNWHLNSDP
jgi:DNA polymerase-4